MKKALWRGVELRGNDGASETLAAWELIPAKDAATRKELEAAVALKYGVKGHETHLYGLVRA